MVQCIMQKIRKKRIWYRNQQQGFSAMELAVVIAIIGVIAAIAVPGMLSMRERYKLRSSATDVVSALKRAKSEALGRDKPVAVVFTAGGYTAFVDDGGGGAGANNLVKDSAAELFLFSGNLKPGTAFASNTFPDPGTGKNIEFNTRGTPALIGGLQTSVGSINIAGSAGSTVYQVALNVAGHVVLKVSTDGGTTFH
jgi:prepilin-type N-terminal cleavage/methylation domain-containing protein